MVRFYKKPRTEGESLEAEEACPFGDEVLLRFENSDGIEIGDELALPIGATTNDLHQILKSLVAEEGSFSLVLKDHGIEVEGSIKDTLMKIHKEGSQKVSTEKVLRLSFYKLASFSVRPITRLHSSMAGHQAPIICCAFSPDGLSLATGSGDSNVRLWDLQTSTPIATLAGHAKSIECIAWSADREQYLASGSEDRTVRVWYTKRPPQVTVSHSKAEKTSQTEGRICDTQISSTQGASASPTGDTDTTTDDGNSGERKSTAEDKSSFPNRVLRGHRHTVTALSWLPAHLRQFYSSGAPRLATGSRDGAIKIWDVVQGIVLTALDGHTQMCTSLKWSGLTSRQATADEKSSGQAASGPQSVSREEYPLLYSSSRDMRGRLWNGLRGSLIQETTSHGHWINSMSLNSEFVLRCGAFLVRSAEDENIAHSFVRKATVEELTQRAQDNWDTAFKEMGQELVCLCSDDNTMTLWNLHTQNKIATLLGHQKAVNHVAFSPNGRFIASAAFDSSVRLWDGKTGKFIHTFRGHVGPVYQISWAPDSNLFVSGSKDSTLKVWDAAARKRKEDLPGHADEIFAVDWAPDGSKVASGGRDKILRIWAH